MLEVKEKEKKIGGELDVEIDIERKGKSKGGA